MQVVNIRVQEQVMKRKRDYRREKLVIDDSTVSVPIICICTFIGIRPVIQKLA
jgi:hypothetical protein